MTDNILEETKLIIMMIIIGAVVCIIGYAFQNWWIVGFGIALAGAIPIIGLIMTILDSV